MLYTGRPVGQVFMENPVVQALLDVNICYNRKYFSYLQLTKMSYLTFVEEYIQDVKKKFTMRDKLRYKTFKLKHGLELRDMQLKKIIQR